MLVSVEPDLNMDFAVVQPLKGEARDLLPHVEGLAHGLVHLGVGKAAGCRVTEDPDKTIVSQYT